MQKPTIENMIERLRLQMAHDNCSLEPPCIEEEIRDLAVAVEREFGVSLPPRYLDLLRITNGFLENGLAVFGSRRRANVDGPLHGRGWTVGGIVEENKDYRANVEEYDQLLLFAYRDHHVYGQVIETGVFIKLNETEEDPRKFYETFEEMIIDAMQDALVT